MANNFGIKVDSLIVREYLKAHELEINRLDGKIVMGDTNRLYGKH